MCKLLDYVAFACVLFAPLVAHAQSAFDIEQLHPQVRAAVVEARTSEQAAQGAAERAREAAAQSEIAAARAREGEDGYGVELYEGDALQRHYEGQLGSRGAQGLGVLTFGSGEFEGDRYAGGFSCRHKHGVGVYQYVTMPSDIAPSRFEGEYDNGRRMGRGVYYTRAGARYAGDFTPSGMDGFAVHYSANGWRYEGEFADSKPNGFGVLWDARGRVMRAGVFENARLTHRLRADSPAVNIVQQAEESDPVVRTCAAELATE